MTQGQLKNLLFVIYSAGFNHGMNEPDMLPEHGIFHAFRRLIVGESPLENGTSYDVKRQIDELLSKCEPDKTKIK